MIWRARQRGDDVAVVPHLDLLDRVVVRRGRRRFEFAFSGIDGPQLHAQRPVPFVDGRLPLDSAAVRADGADDDLVLNDARSEVDADSIRRMKHVGDAVTVDAQRDLHVVRRRRYRQLDDAFEFAVGNRRVAFEQDLRGGACIRCNENDEECEELEPNG